MQDGARTSGGVAGIVFTILFLVVGSLPPERPELATASPDAITSYYLEHGSAFGFYLFGLSIAILFLIWFLGGLRATLAAIEGFPNPLASVAFGSGILAVALFFGEIALGSVLLFQDVKELEPDVLTTLFSVRVGADALLAASSFPRALLIAATSLVIVRSGALSRWLGWFGAVVAALSIFGGFSYVMQDAAPWALSMMGFALWVLVTSIIFVRTNRRSRAT